jgi:hypothetical protein
VSTDYRFVSQPVCICRHTAEAHEHSRRGRDCSVCDCRRFRAIGSVDWLAVTVWIVMPVVAWLVLGLIVYGAVRLFDLIF